jgi:hypothetical protein
MYVYHQEVMVNIVKRVKYRMTRTVEISGIKT